MKFKELNKYSGQEAKTILGDLYGINHGLFHENERPTIAQTLKLTSDFTGLTHPYSAVISKDDTFYIVKSNASNNGIELFIDQDAHQITLIFNLGADKRVVTLESQDPVIQIVYPKVDTKKTPDKKDFERIHDRALSAKLWQQNINFLKSSLHAIQSPL